MAILRSYISPTLKLLVTLIVGSGSGQQADLLGVSTEARGCRSRKRYAKSFHSQPCITPKPFQSVISIALQRPRGTDAAHDNVHSHHNAPSIIELTNGRADSSVLLRGPLLVLDRLMAGAQLRSFEPRRRQYRPLIDSAITLWQS